MKTACTGSFPGFALVVALAAFSGRAVWSLEKTEPELGEAVLVGGQNTTGVGLRMLLLPFRVRPGGQAVLRACFAVPAGFKVYQRDLEITLKGGAGFALGRPRLPLAVKKYDEGFMEERWVYLAPFTVEVPVTVPDDGGLGRRTFAVEVRFQACATGGQCFFTSEPPVYQVAVSVDPQVVPAAGENKDQPAGGVQPGADASVTGTGAPGEAASLGAWELLRRGRGEDVALALERAGRPAVLVFLLLLGALMVLSPCVLPILPATLAILGAGREASRRRGLVLGLAFLSGVLVICALLGLLAGSAAALLTRLNNSTAFNVAMTLVFFALALAAYGAYDLQAPAFLRERLGTKGGGGRVGGALVMGVLSVVLAGACTAPVFAGLMVFASQTNWATALLLMMALGFGYGLPFVVLGATAAALPRPGTWMNAVKAVFGTLIMLAAVYFLSRWLGGWGLDLVLGALLVTGAVFLGGVDRLEAGAGAGARLKKALGLLVLLAGVCFAGGGLLRSGLIALPPAPSSGGPIAVAERINWLHTEEEGLKAAAESGKIVMLDFRSEACSACKKLEREIFSDPRVVTALKRDFVPVKIDLTGNPAREVATMKKHEVTGQPTLLFLDSGGQPYRELTLNGFLDAETLVAHLQKVKRRAERP